MSGETVCAVCVMDDSMAPLHLDDHGQCQCCRDALARWPHEYFPGEEGVRRLDALVARLRKEGRTQPYDCMIGLSGGIDSAYLAHVLATRYQLRTLAIHVDGGWNTEASVHNIERIVRALGIDLHTEVIEWSEMRDVQRAFLRSGVINQDIPQDHAFFVSLYRLADRFGIRTFLSGVNFATECVAQSGAGHPSMDGRHLRAVHKRFGDHVLRRFPVMTIPEYLYRTRVRRILKVEKPLNFLSFSKAEAVQQLREAYGWTDYGTKHAESRFTKFYQQIYLPRRFGFDKRRLHLSSLIVTGQMTREEACAELANPETTPEQAYFDLVFVAKKLDIPAAEVERFMDLQVRPHAEIGGDAILLQWAQTIRRTLRTVLKFRRDG